MTDASAVARTLQVPAVAASGVTHNARAAARRWLRRLVVSSGLDRTIPPHTPHPLDDETSLLYVGIGAPDARPRQTLRSRVMRNHLNGNVGSSTFPSSSPRF